MRKFFMAAAAAAVLVVLLAGARGTAALWRASEDATPGTVSTGRLSLAVGNGAELAKDHAFTALDTSALAPGGFAQAPLAVGNTGTVGLGYNLAGASSSTPLPRPADLALAAAVELTIHASPDPAACAAGTPGAGSPLYKGPLGALAAFAQPRELAAPGHGATQETLCVRVALPAGSPQAAAGGRLALVLSWKGGQL